MAEFNRRKKKVCAMCTGKTVDNKEKKLLSGKVKKKIERER